MSLQLRHTPGEWDGTFAVTVRQLVENVLNDGPIEVTVNDEARPRTLAGYDPVNDCLVFDGNQTIDMDELEGIEVP